MPAGWAALAAGVVGAGAAVYGANKQAGAAEDAANLSQGQFALNNAQQQPYIQSGYGALGKLNTLMGIGGAPTSQSIPPNQQGPQKNIQPIRNPMGNPNGSLNAVAENAPGITEPTSNQNPQLRQLLAIRAQHGDPQAAQMLKMVV